MAKDCLNDIADVLTWLVDVEKSRQAEYAADGENGEDAADGDNTADTGGDNEDNRLPA